MYSSCFITGEFKLCLCSYVPLGIESRRWLSQFSDFGTSVHVGSIFYVAFSPFALFFDCHDPSLSAIISRHSIGLASHGDELPSLSIFFCLQICNYVITGSATANISKHI